MSCEFCKGNFGQTVSAEASIGTIEMYNGELNYEYDGYHDKWVSDYFTINYCPMCGRRLQEDKADSRKELLQELTTASNFLCDTALLFTHPKYEDTYPEWSGVYSVGTFLEEVVKQLESEVTADDSD